MPARTKKKARTRARTAKRQVRILVLRAPGTNCDRETGYAFEREGATIQHLGTQHQIARRAMPGAPGPPQARRDRASKRCTGAELRWCKRQHLALFGE